MPGPTTTVVITISGVDLGTVPRVETAVKTHLTRFGTSIVIDKQEPQKGKK